MFKTILKTNIIALFMLTFWTFAYCFLRGVMLGANSEIQKTKHESDMMKDWGKVHMHNPN